MPTRPFPAPPTDHTTAPASLCIDISSPGAGTLVITPVGEADVGTVAPLRLALAEARGAGRPSVIVDLDQLAFMDASTLGVLVEARLSIAAVGGELTVRCRNGQRRRLLSIAGLDGMLDLAS